jgi:TonB family protein
MRNYPSLLVLALLLAGCGRGAAKPAASLPRVLPLEVLADRAPDASLTPGRMESLRVTPEPPRLVLLRVAPGRGAIAAPPPDAAPAEPPASAAPAPSPPSDDRLLPPVPRGGTRLQLAGARGRWVELDVRVDEDGRVSVAEFAGGDADTALVRSAIAAARGTRWYPAQQGGHAVAVWCRQRFEVPR